MNGICSRQKGDKMHIKRLIRKPQATEPLGRDRHKWKGNIKMNLMKWIVSVS
jgi:gluconate kinase